MTTQSHATPAATWVAIDIAKRYHAVLVEGPDGKHQRFRMANQCRSQAQSADGSGYQNGQGRPWPGQAPNPIPLLLRKRFTPWIDPAQ